MPRMTVATFTLLTGLMPAAAGEFVTLAPATADAPMAYVDGPVDSPRAVSFVYDYLGISPATRAEVERLAAEGFRVLAVDLYTGEPASTGPDAEMLMSARDAAYAQETVALAIDVAAIPGSKIGIVGYSMGGSIGLEALLRSDVRAEAAAAIYGGGYDAFGDSDLKDAGPMLLITGSNDAWSHPALIAFQDRMHTLGDPIETYVIPDADHGYARPYFLEGKNLDQAAIAATHLVVDQFLSRHLAP